MRAMAFLLAGAVLLVAGCSSDDSSSAPQGSAGQAGSGSGGTAGAGQGGGAGTGQGGSGQGGSGTGGGAQGGSGTGGGAQGGSGGSPGSLPVVGGCTVFTGDDDWNKDISNEPVDAQWTANVLALAGDIHLHPDFGNWGGESYGIPINIVPQNQPMVPVAMDWYEDESDPGPYPFPVPPNVKIEGNNPAQCDGDCHLLAVQQGTCKLYEGYACEYQNDGWHCGNGAIWDLTKLSYGQRPMGWTSADAAGLPIMPGLIRYDEVAADAVNHAIRFTLSCSRSKYVKPATHFAVPNSCSDADTDPPMGLRVRLKASFDISGFNAQAQAILKAMKKYGMILADNGSDFFFQAETHASWNDDVQQLKDVPVSEFEAIVPGPLQP